MQFVEIYKIQNDGSQRIIAVCKLIERETKCEGDKTFIENLRQDGIFDYSKKHRQRLFPKDGIDFLEGLKFAFRSGYLNASEVKEK